MSIIKDFTAGFSFAIRLILKRNLWKYFIPSLFISSLFFLLFNGGLSLGRSLNFMEDWWGIGWIISKSKLFVSFLGFMILEFFILVALSPINSYFAEQTKEEITNIPTDFSIIIFLKSLKRMVVILLFAFFMQCLISLFLWAFSFVLGDQFYELASLLNVSFFIGFSFFDFSLELDDVNRKESWKFGKKNWLSCIVIGLLVNLGIYYPQKHDLIIVYFISIVFLPHILTIISSYLYYNSKKKSPQIETT